VEVVDEELAMMPNLVVLLVLESYFIHPGKLLVDV
jgi:hypothetical protein